MIFFQEPEYQRQHLWSMHRQGRHSSLMIQSLEEKKTAVCLAIFVKVLQTAQSTPYTAYAEAVVGKSRPSIKRPR